jgi:hypothetical protein
MPCCKDSEKGSLEFWKNRGEKRKMRENGKVYMESDHLQGQHECGLNF